MFGMLLRHMRGLPEGAPQQTMLLQEATRQAASLPTSFAIPALLSALQVGLAGFGTSHCYNARTQKGFAC